MKRFEPTATVSAATTLPPSSSAVEMVRAILHDEKRVLPAAAWCTGAFAFACAVGPDSLPADLAIKHHQARREEARAERRRAA